MDRSRTSVCVPRLAERAVRARRLALAALPSLWPRWNCKKSSKWIPPSPAPVLLRIETVYDTELAV